MDCSGKAVGSFYPDPDPAKCDVYHWCTGNDIATIMRCAWGTIFDQSTKTCVFGDSCGVLPATTPTSNTGKNRKLVLLIIIWPHKILYPTIFSLKTKWLTKQSLNDLQFDQSIIR